MNSAGVRRGGTRRSVNWQSTPNGLLCRISIGLNGTQPLAAAWGSSVAVRPGISGSNALATDQCFPVSPEAVWSAFCWKIWSPAGFWNFSVMRSDSPIARYLSLSWSPSVNVGGNVQTPFA
jgi:hypothetical protein